MTEFINEFAVKEQVTELLCYSMKYEKKFEQQHNFDKKMAAEVAAKLSGQMRTPIAAVGGRLVSNTDVNIRGVVTITTKIEGKPTDIEVDITNSVKLKKNDMLFNDAVKKFLNRRADLILTRYGYEQDNRSFFEKKVKAAGSKYGFKQGIDINAHVSDGGWQSIVIDPVTQVRNKLDLRKALNEELAKRSIKHWKDASDEDAEEINKQFRTKADNIRSTYVEQRGDEVTHNRYRFEGFDFKNGLIIDSDPANPVNFHKKYGRTFDMDQPVVRLVARGGFQIQHVPQLLEEVPSLHVMKRYGASTEIQTRSLMQANDRYYMTADLLQPLVKENFIEKTPAIVSTEYFGPVMLIVKGDYIEIKTNLDFQKIFAKRKILTEPRIRAIHFFSTSKDAVSAENFKKVLVVVFQDFGLPVPELKSHSDCADDFIEFADCIIATAKKEQYSEEDLVIPVFKPDKEGLEDILYNKIKAESLESLFPVQFIESPRIAKKDEKELRKSLVNPVFLQIVAKCMGQPYGLQEGFMPTGTLFVGIDRYRDPYKKDALLVTSVVLFDEFGGYICSATNIAADNKTVPQVKPLIEESLAEYERIRSKKPRLILYLLDTGPGTMEEQLLAEAKDCEEVSSRFKAEYAYVTANKGTRLRLYTGDPNNELTAKRVRPFTAVTRMRDSREILVVSTEPIISLEKKRELGTPKPVLYKILASNSSGSQDELKRLIAKSIVWLCTHSWISPGATRLPAPLYFANKVGRLTAVTNKIVKPDRSKAPLYL